MPHLVRLVFSHLVSVLINPSVLTLPLPSSPLIVHLSFRLSILSYNPSQSASPLYSHMSSLHGFRCTSSRHSVHHGICRMSSITAPVVYYSIVIKGLWSFTHSSKVRQSPGRVGGPLAKFTHSSRSFCRPSATLSKVPKMVPMANF